MPSHRYFLRSYYESPVYLAFVGLYVRIFLRQKQNLELEEKLLEKTAILLSFLIASCLIIDKLLIKRHKGQLYDYLHSKFFVVDEMSVPDLPGFMINITCKYFRRFYKFLFVLISFSISLLILYAGGRLQDPYTILFVAAANVPFDFLTISVTYWFLNGFSKRSRLENLLALVWDIFIAVALAYVCAVTLYFVSGFSEDDFAIAIFLPSTTLVPTLIYMTVLVLVLLISLKVCLFIAKLLSMFFIERAVDENDPKNIKVFTVGATIISIPLIIITAMLKFSQLL